MSLRSALQAERQELSGAQLRAAQMRAFARQTPVNALVTLTTSSLTGVILWPVAPRPWVACWVGLHWVISLTVLARWWHHRRQPRRRRRGTAGPRRAKIWAFISGLVWGVGAGFLPLLPPTHQLALIIVVGAMAGGASTTLAAVPAAAAAFIVSAILPFAAYFVLQADPVYFGLASMALVMTLAMLGSTRIVYRSFMEQLKAEQKAADLLDQFDSSRREWLAISETTEAFAMFDADDKLLLWNDNYRRVLSLPEGCLFRGADHCEILSRSAPPVEVEHGDVPLETWVDEQVRLPERVGGPVMQRLASGRWLRSTARRTPGGHCVVVHMDVTELKQTEDRLRQREAELRQAQKLETIGRLAGGVAHDFNNLLTIINGYCGLLMRDLADHESQKKKVMEIGKAAQRASWLTRQLLAFSRKQVMKPTVLDLNAVVADMKGMLARLIGEDVVLETRLEAAPGTVKADPVQIEQVILNLAVNARDAMPQGGKFTIETADVTIGEEGTRRHVAIQPGKYVRLTFSDTGCGMDAEIRERAFEPFFTTKDEKSGTGLGLSTVYGIIKQSRGDVRIQSEPGAGTKLHVFLPEAEGVVAEPRGTVIPDSDERGTETILVAEDEEGVRSFICDVLRAKGYTVLEAADGAEALRESDRCKEPIDLLLTDVVMPGMDGHELYGRLAAARPGIRALYMSGYAADVIGRRGVLGPGTAFLQKPFQGTALLRRVREVLG